MSEYFYHSPVGELYIRSERDHIVEISFCSERRDRADRDDAVSLAVKWLDIYFSGKAPDFTPPLDLDGLSPFRRRVCELMLDIPYGTLVCYGDIAKTVASETGTRPCAQAVGGAVGANNICIIVPCHRVVGKNNCLTGYAPGIDKKIALLALEGIDVSKYSLPRKQE